MNKKMISVEEALELVLSHVHVLEKVRVALLESQGLVLAEDIKAKMNVPPADNSAMDGYAVRAEDIIGATSESPRLLQVIGEVAAGHVAGTDVRPGTTIRIMTGAPLPAGADSVVPFECTDEAARRKARTKSIKQISVLTPVKWGENVRRAGEDVTEGAQVLGAGTALRSAEIGVLASLGMSTVPVYRQPVVGILATGDEVVDISEPLPPGKIYNSNTYTLAAQVRRYGAKPVVLGVAPDEAAKLTAAIKSGLQTDMLITSGGVSLGDYDMVKDVLAAEGEIGFWTVRMKPGKPLAFGVLRHLNRTVPHLGLPGNPVSSMVTFEMFARPSILKMLGKKNLAMPSIEARLEQAVRNTDGRRIFLRVRVTKEHGEFIARLTGNQGSGILTSMSMANGLAIVPESVKEIHEGDAVEVLMPDWNEDQC
ncbi:MAG: molybdopterin molybdotransferase MoeA [Chloroflexi bacterium]|nr:molybdopterin molybdotransferase MoeA [Chloroflexota bacterium]